MEGSNEYEVTHSVTYNVQKTWMRISMLSWTYAEIAEAAFSDFLKIRYDPILDNEDDDLHYKKTQVEKRLVSTSIQTIVFAAMACEAAIYDLAAIHLGEKRAGLVDKMDAIGKWSVVPHLICGRGLDLDGAAINSLRKLVSTRNSLVHYKSLPGEMSMDAFAKGDKQIRTVIESTATCFQAIVLLSLELNRVLKTVAGVLPFYENHIRDVDKGRSDELLKILNSCRNIEGKAIAKNDLAI